jgi:hypothetical protein
MYKRCFKNVYILNINDICPNKCGGLGECKEVIGCVCKKNHISNDCTERVKCKDDCNNNGVCHNNAKCGCFPGWNGVLCRTLIPCAKNCTDFNSGVCQPDSTCKCKPGFAGKDCSTLTIVGNNTDSKMDPFKALTALSAKKIKIDKKKLDSYSNKHPKKNKTRLCPNGCNGHGSCNFKTGKCTCEASYGALDCSFKKPPVLKRQTKGGDDESSDDDDKKVKSGVDPSSASGSASASGSTSGSTSTTSAATGKKNSPDSESGDSNDESNNAASAAPTEKQKLEIQNLKVYKTGEANEIYYQTTDCYGNCTKRGLCLNSTCFCEQGYASSDCSMTYKQYLEQGIKFSDVSGILIGAFGLSLVATIVVLLIRKAQKVTRDHIEFE